MKIFEIAKTTGFIWMMLLAAAPYLIIAGATITLSIATPFCDEYTLPHVITNIAWWSNYMLHLQDEAMFWTSYVIYVPFAIVKHYLTLIFVFIWNLPYFEYTIMLVVSRVFAVVDNLCYTYLTANITESAGCCPCI